MRVSSRELALLCIVGAQSACDLWSSGCTTELRPMIIATVTDSRTGEALVGGVTLVAYSSAGRDSTTYEGTPAGVTTVTLYPRILGAGAYSVEIRHPGYLPFRQTDVLVRLDRCGKTIAVSIGASLTPL